MHMQMSWRQIINANTNNNELFDHYKQQRRQHSCRKLLRRFPGRVPVIVEKLQTTIAGNNKLLTSSNHSSNGSIIDNNKDINDTTKRYKFLVPYDCTVGQFQWILRNKIEMLAPNQAIYLIVDRTLPHASCLIGELYCQYQDDGYLYIYYSGENTFGCISEN